MEKLKREMISKDDSGLHYVVDDISTRFGVSIAEVQAITQFSFKKPHLKLLNTLWSNASRDFILHGESVFSFDEIKVTMDDSTLNKDRILHELSEINDIVTFEEEDGISYSHWWLIDGVRYNEEAISIAFNRKLIRTIIHKEVLLKNAEKLDCMESDYVRQLFLNIESERIENKLKRKSTKIIVISPSSLFYGLEVYLSEFSDEEYAKKMLLLQLTKSDNYLRTCKLNDDGNVTLEFFKAIKYDMKDILLFQWL